MAVKKGLGKGLDSLITDKVSKPVKPKSEHAADAVMIDIKKVEPNREQPRKKFDEDPLYKVVPYKDMPETIQKLKDAGLKMAVCSNKPHIAAQKVVKAIYGDVFDEVMGQQEGIRRKPLPEKFENYVNVGGFMLLMGLMVVILANDILKIIH